MRKKCTAAIILLSIILCLCSCSGSKSTSYFSIQFIDVGQGDSALVECDGHRMLIDGGDTTAGNKVYSILEDKQVRRLDILAISHLHKDHIGGLPYILDRFPDVTVYGSAKCMSILERENARKLMEELGMEARDLYTPDSDEPIRTDNLRVDAVLADGDTVSLGEETMTAYETKGHTDCSLSYYFRPAGILFTSESTGHMPAALRHDSKGVQR